MKAVRIMVSLVVLLSFSNFYLQPLIAESAEEGTYIQVKEDQPVLVENMVAEAGKIFKDTVLKVERVEGELVFFQWNDTLVKLNSSDVQFVNANNEEFSYVYSHDAEVKILANADTPILNKDGSVIAKLHQHQEYRLYKEENSEYMIIVGNQLGRISKENVSKMVMEEEASPEEEIVIPPTFGTHFMVTRDGVPIYKEDRSTIIGYLTEGQEYAVASDEKEVLRIQYGGGSAYVVKQGIVPSDGKAIKNASRHFVPLASFVVERNTTVYDNSAGALVPFAVLQAGGSYPLVKIMGNWVEVNIAGRFGYVHINAINRDFMDTDQHFRVVTDKAAIYENRNGQLVAVGFLHKDQEFKMERRYGNWHQIKYGNTYRYIAKKETEPASGISKGKTGKGVSGSSTVKITKEAVIYDNSTGTLIPFALLSEGEIYPIIKKMGNWFEIELSGRIGYIHVSAAQLTQPISKDIVNPKQLYTYDKMARDIGLLVQTYPDLIQSTIIGKSVDGRNIYALKLGTGNKEIFFNGSHHAREYISTNLLMEMIDTYAQSYVKNTKIGSYNTRVLLDQVSIWFVPMVNPDGVTLVQLGHKSAKNPSAVLKLNRNNTNFAAWKANIRGVDLNRQYPANWANICCDPGKPGPQNYKGPKPLSEPEAQTLYQFATSRSFLTAVSYHSSGQILFWHFHQDSQRQKRDYAIAKKIANETGYSMVAPRQNPSGGGFTDWFISSQKLPAFTPELAPYVGNGPVPIRYFDRIWQQNQRIGLMLAQEALKIS